MLKTDINYIGKMKEGIQRMKPKTKDSGDSKKDINLLYFNQDNPFTLYVFTKSLSLSISFLEVESALFFTTKQLIIPLSFKTF